MKYWQKENSVTISSGNNRINLIIAIIFLLGISILIKLYNLQVRDYDLYAAKATGQHQVYSILEPERGKIFIQDDVENGEKLYPMATNKEFALVYAVPKDIEDPEYAAESLYEVFKKKNIEEEVDELMEEEDEKRLEKELAFINSLGLPTGEQNVKAQEVINNHKALIKDKDYLELKEIKREKEIEARKENVINDYLKNLIKKNDPYEPIEKKVDEVTLKNLFILLNKKEGMSAEDLEIKGDKLFIKSIYNENEEINFKGVAFISKTRRYYPEGNIGSHILGFVGYVDDEERGRYGLEGFFDEELYGIPGSIKTGRGAQGDLIIINDREYNRAKNGKDLVLTINKTVQYIACQKLNETALRLGADGGSVIIMEPKTGAILAMCSWPDYDPNKYNDVEYIDIFNNPAIFSQYEPGSIFKTITMAAALDQEKITPETTYIDKGQVMVSGWPKPIKNSDYDSHGGHGLADMTTVLEESLNTGIIFAMQKIGPEIFSNYVKEFGFGEKSGIELETESAGDIKNLLGDNIQEIYAATASFGQGIATTPLQMVSAYAAIANGGILMKPYLVDEIIYDNGLKDKTQPVQIKRVISERTSILLSGMLARVVEGGHAKRAGVSGYYIAGKTGTAQVAAKNKRGYGSRSIHTFVGFAPIDEPKFVMLVKLDDPKGIEFSASTAAPLFGEIAESILNYYEIPKER